MKKILELFLFCLLVSFIISCDSDTGKHTKNQPRFAVISDVHFGSPRKPVEKVSRALDNILSMEPKVDAIFVVGDLTNSGTEPQYDDLNKVFTEKVPSDIPVYYMMGNHDNYSSDAKNIYLNKMNQSTLHQYFTIKDYPFITVSMTGSNNNGYDSVSQEFLSKNLADAAQKYPGKPIFVFTHVPVINTVYGSLSSEGWGTNKFEDILNQYPQSIVFSGHSHFPLEDPRSIHQGKFTSINDGSTTYSEVESGVVNAGIHPENYEDVTEGVIVNVFNNKDVELEKWDTYRNTEILPRWKVKAPHNGTAFAYSNRDGMPAPEFLADTKPVVTNVGDQTCTVTFPQAKDNEVVHHYILEASDNTGVVSSFRVFSQYYLSSNMPAELKVEMIGLPSGANLTIKVTAVDSYNNKSASVLSEPFTTKTYTPNDKTKLPKADLLDITFNTNGTAKDASGLRNKILAGATIPTVSFNNLYNRNVAVFNGTNTCFYKIDYTKSKKIKEAFTNGFSFEILYKTNTTTNVCPLSAQEGGGAGIEQVKGGQIQFLANIGGGYKAARSVVNAEAEKYYHVICTYDKSEGKTFIYVNGIKVGETNAKGNFSFPKNEAAHWIAIGGDASPSGNAQFSLNGDIAIARMYGKALSRDEILLLNKNLIKK